MPRLIKSALTYFLPQRDGELLLAFNRKTVTEERGLVVEREEWKRVWHQKWKDEKIDFVLSAPVPIPGIPEGGTEICGLTPASYLFLFNILDLPAGVLPVTHVSRDLDSLSPHFMETLKTHAARNTFKLYDADKMHGLPVSVQIVGPRLEEERVLAGMEVVREALFVAQRQAVKQAE